MSEYKGNKLRKYILDSELRIVDNNFRVRLSHSLAKNYDAGDYDDAINLYANYIKRIKDLNIKYPGNANPIFYLYLVPDENFIELLDYSYDTSSGGKPVLSYDLDGFNYAYGESQNLCYRILKPTMLLEASTIHEFAHLVHSQFFRKTMFLCEGFADTLTFYILDCEAKLIEHRNTIKNMKKSQVLSAKQLLDMEEEGTFYGGATLLPNKSCSFDLTYISSYLFVRGYISTIEEKLNLNKIEAMQRFLEIVRNSRCVSEWLIFELADALEVSRDELLYGRDMQFRVLDEL